MSKNPTDNSSRQATADRGGSENGAAVPVRIYVSLTTIPPRMPGIERCIASLLAQTVLPEKILVCIPVRYKRFAVDDPLPLDLSRFGDRVEIIRCAEDFGPGTKLLGSFDRARQDKAALLVLVDDDMIYQPHMIETFARNFEANPRAAASFFTYRYRGLTTGQGADGFALPVGRLGGLWDFHRKISKCPEAFFVDDLWLSYFLWLNEVPIVDLSAMSGPHGYIFHIYNDVQALNREAGAFARRRVMRRTLWSLRRHFGWRETLRRVFFRRRAGHS